MSRPSTDGTWRATWPTGQETGRVARRSTWFDPDLPMRFTTATRRLATSPSDPPPLPVHLFDEPVRLRDALGRQRLRIPLQRLARAVRHHAEQDCLRQCPRVVEATGRRSA